MKPGTHPRCGTRDTSCFRPERPAQSHPAIIGSNPAAESAGSIGCRRHVAPTLVVRARTHDARCFRPSRRPWESSWAVDAPPCAPARKSSCGRSRCRRDPNAACRSATLSGFPRWPSSREKRPRVAARRSQEVASSSFTPVLAFIRSRPSRLARAIRRSDWSAGRSSSARPRWRSRSLRAGALS